MLHNFNFDCVHKSSKLMLHSLFLVLVMCNRDEIKPSLKHINFKFFMDEGALRWFCYV
jgi:hypothetical protein